MYLFPNRRLDRSFVITRNNILRCAAVRCNFLTLRCRPGKPGQALFLSAMSSSPWFIIQDQRTGLVVQPLNLQLVLHELDPKNVHQRFTVGANGGIQHVESGYFIVCQVRLYPEEHRWSLNDEGQLTALWLGNGKPIVLGLPLRKEADVQTQLVANYSTKDKQHTKWTLLRHGVEPFRPR